MEKRHWKAITIGTATALSLISIKAAPEGTKTVLNTAVDIVNNIEQGGIDAGKWVARKVWTEWINEGMVPDRTNANTTDDIQVIKSRRVKYAENLFKKANQFQPSGNIFSSIKSR